MKIKDNDTEIVLPERAIEAIKHYAIAIMDVQRAADPASAWCWNFCRVWFDGSASPEMCWGCNEADVTWRDSYGPTFIVAHPKQIKAPPAQ